MLTYQTSTAEENVGEASWMRKLNNTEHLFWLLDQKRPVHFAMVAEIDRRFPTGAWHSALHALQARHPLLSTRISEDAQMNIGFYRVPEAEIPLRVLERKEASWQVEVERELSLPFNWSRAPLLRATLLQDRFESTLILVAHHSLLDGKGSAYLIEDLLRLLSGERLTQLELLPPFDVLLEKDIASAGLPPEIPPPPVPKTFRPDMAATPDVNALALSRDFTLQLINRARDEQTTVQGAIAAATREAGRRLSREWCDRPLRTSTPIDIRYLADEVGTAAGAYITRAITDDDQPLGASFWDAARRSKAQVASSQERTRVLSELARLNTVMSSKPTSEHVAAYLSGVLGFDILLSNLGNQPIASTYNGLTLNALWGPFAMSGLSDDQMIGICTVGGMLRLAHSSYGAIPGLLEEIRAVLEVAVIE